MPSMEFQQRGMEPPLTTTRQPSTTTWKAPPMDKPPLVTPSASPPPSRPYHQHSASTTSGTRPWLGQSARDQPSHQTGPSSRFGSSSPFTHANHNRTSSSVPPRQQSRAPSRVSSTPKPGGFFKSSTPSSSSSASFRRGSSAAASSSSSLRSSVFGNRFLGGGQPELSDADIEREREASLMRLMGAWTSLEKYVKRLDEDDIIDLETGKIIKDNGVLKSARTKRFGAADEGEEAEEDVEEDEEDEFDDQLDTLGDLDLDDEDGEGDGGLEIRVPNALVPPMTPNDARYAEDLQTFLEKEKHIGTEPEDDPDNDHAFEELLDETDGGVSSEVHSDGVFGLDDQGDDGTDYYDELLPVVSDYPGPEDTDSEDELNCNFVEDEASMIIPVVKDEGEPQAVIDLDDDSEIEIIEPPLPPKPKSAGPSKKPTEKLKPVQLFTPPHSRSSAQTPLDEEYATPPPAPVDFDLPAPDVSPEVPITATNSLSSLPPPPFARSSTSPKKPQSRIFPTPSKSSSPFVSQSNPATAKKSKEETQSVPVPPPRKFKLKAEVVIERRTPMPQTKPAKEPHPQSSLRAESIAKSKEKVLKLKEVVDSGSEVEEVVKGRSAPPSDAKKPRKAPLSKVKPPAASATTPPPSKPKKKVNKEEESSSSSKPKSSSSRSKAVPSPSSTDVEEEVAPVNKVADESSPRKRKRNASAGPSTQRDRSPEKKVSTTASSSKGKGRHTEDDSDVEEARESSKSAKAARRSVHERSPRKRRSKSRSRVQSSSSSSESEQERDRRGRDRRSPDTHPHDHYHNSRAGSYIPPNFPTYPPPQPSHPFPPHQQTHPQVQHNPPPSASSGPPHAFPAFDPSQMYMFTQMMAAAMTSGQWGMPPPMASGPPPQHHQYRDPSHPPSSPSVQYPQGPFTPTHPFRRSHSQGPGDTSGHNIPPMYSTPTHNHSYNHPMYAHGSMPQFPGYAMNPDFSRGTAPPDTPESALASSPIKKSLVERSRSRGRRVSFVDDRDRERSKSKGKARGKGKRRERSRSESESGSQSQSEEDEDEDDEDEEMMDVGSSPLKGKSREKERRDSERKKERDRDRGRARGKEKERPKKSASSSSSNAKSKDRRRNRICSPEEVEEVADSEGDGMLSDSSDDMPLSDHVRAQTPGPPESPPSKEREKRRRE